MRIVFMGTPDFAVASLDILVRSEHKVVGVITAPDRPAGRGMKLRPSAVKQYAVEHDLTVLQPVKLRDPAFLADLEALEADLAVVVAFRMLPTVVWKMPKMGTFNLHASLLPDYRGAAPINWAVINGESASGVTTFLIDEKIDTGNILLQEKVAIPASWTAGNLHDSLMEVGAKLVLKTVNGLVQGELKAHPQDDSMARNKAPKIFKEDCEIDWSQEVQQVYNFIRGLSPYPTAWTTLNGQLLKLIEVSISGEHNQQSPGSIRVDPKNGIFEIACQDAWLQVHKLQLQGKRRMNAGDFVRGFKGELESVSSKET